MPNPALRQRGQSVEIVKFDGTSATVKGVVRNFETTASEANLPFADAGPIAWLDHDGDPRLIEFLEYIEPGTGARLHRRVTHRDRIGTIYPCVKMNMSSDSITLPSIGDFSAQDFSSESFAT